MPVTFVPFGELRPDAKKFRHDGLQQAKNVIPLHGNYIVPQNWIGWGGAPLGQPYGLHAHYAGGSDSFVYYGLNAALYQSARSNLNSLADKTRTVGGPYSASTNLGWYGASFGDAICMTDYTDDPQLLVNPATANFVKLAQSGGGNPGMDPKAQFCFPVKANFCLANLNLAAPFDTLPAGANPTVLAWSQSENMRQYGSQKLTPELTGTGYQPLNYDQYGHITGGIGGEYGAVAMQGGWVLMEGPPYTMRPVARGFGCRFPNSIARLGDDIYFWGAQGPAVLRGGEQPVWLGTEKVSRTLIDNATGFSPTYSVKSSTAARSISCATDQVNGLVAWAYETTSGSKVGDITLFYNPTDGRFSFVHNLNTNGTATGITFLRSFPDNGSAWAPGRDYVAAGEPLAGAWAIHTPSYDLAGAPAPTLETAFLAINDERVTRILWVRPIYTRSDLLQAMTVTVTVSSLNKPYQVPASASGSSENDQGQIPVTDSVFANFHAVAVTWATDAVGAGLQKIMEIEGIEIGYAVGGEYSA